MLIPATISTLQLGAEGFVFLAFHEIAQEEPKKDQCQSGDAIRYEGEEVIADAGLPERQSTFARPRDKKHYRRHENVAYHSTLRQPTVDNVVSATEVNIKMLAFAK